MECPACSAESDFALIEPTYEGPFRCWRCSSTFLATIENGELKSCRPISEEELGQYQK